MNRFKHRFLLRQIVFMFRNHFKMLLFLLLIIGLSFNSLKKLLLTELNTFLLFRRHQFLLILGEVFRCQDALKKLSALTNSSDGGEGGESGVVGLPTPAPGGPRGGTT